MMKPPLAHARLDIESDLDNLIRVRVFVREFLSRSPCRMDRKRIDWVELAANEIVANIVRHAYHEQPDGSITIEIEGRSDQMTLRFYDQGDRWDPQSAPAPVFDGTKDGGFGLYIINQAVDRIDYSRDANGTNCACLTVRLQEGNNGV